jgi:hypothetical protein
MSVVKANPAQAELARFVNLLNTLNGRDKFAKAVQYAARLTAFMIAAGYTSHDAEVGKRLSKLSGAMSQTRKGFRLLKSLSELEGLIQILQSDRDLLVKVLSIIGGSCFAVYWHYDTKVFLAKIGYVDGSAADFSLRGGQWWFVGLTARIILAFVLLQREIAQRNELQRESAKNLDQILKLNASISGKKLSLVINLLDMFSCLHQSQLREFGDGVLGTTGLVSAMLTLYKLYPSA